MLTLLFKGVQKFLFASGVNGCGGAPSAANISANIRKKFKFETVLMGYLGGAGGILIHEKKPEVENIVTLSL